MTGSRETQRPVRESTWAAGPVQGAGSARGIRTPPEAGSCSIPPSSRPLTHSQKSPLGGTVSVTQQEWDILIDSPCSRREGETLREIRGAVVGKGVEPGQVEKIDACNMGTIIGPFHKCGD